MDPGGLKLTDPTDPDSDPQNTESRYPDPGSSQNPIIGPDLSTTVSLLDPDPDLVFFLQKI